MPTSYELFTYIHKPDKEHQPCEVIENKYPTIADLGRRFIVKGPGGYRVYPGISECLQDLEELPEKMRCFHEVILSKKQKLKFDIDAPADKVSEFVQIFETDDDYNGNGDNGDVQDTTTNIFTAQTKQIVELITNDQKYNHIFDVILQTIKDTFFIVYGKELTSEVICESKDPTGQKYSNHIILDGYCVSNNIQAAEFTRKVAAYLPTNYHPFVDWGVNKSIQNFRMPLNHKENEVRTKEIMYSDNSYDEVLSALITATDDCELLPNLVTDDKTHITSKVHSEDINAILNMYSAKTGDTSHVFKYAHRNALIFERVEASMCDFCNRVHDLDNTLILTTYTSSGVVSVYRKCRKDTNKRSVFIGEIMSGVLGGDVEKLQNTRLTAYVDRMLDVTINQLTTGHIYSTKTLFDTLPNSAKHIYCEPTLRPFELAPTLVVHAAMKMGKTKKLIDLLATHFNSTLKPPVVRFLSFRQTFSGNIKEKFADFALYSDTKGPLDQQKLIVQVESLHRLVINEETPDLLILDECESIFEQFNSGLLKGNFNDCFAKFQYLLKYSKHVVCMDAMISDRTFRILHQIRPIQPLYHHNTWQNSTADKYIMLGNKEKWLTILYDAIDSGEKIAIPSSSLSVAETLAEVLKKKYPEKQIMLYSSKTTNGIKKEHFDDVNLYWSTLDVLIYTPTVTAGVSFEQKHFDKVFGYFIDASCPVETCIQMIGRIRDVGSRELYICLAATGNNLPTTIDDIKRYLITKRENLFKNFDDSGLQIEYGPNGAMILHACNYLQIWLENQRMQNLSANAFIKRFIHVVSMSGAKFKFCNNELFEEITGLDCSTVEARERFREIAEQHTITKRELTAAQCVAVARARELSEDEVEVIRYNIIAQKDISQDDQAAFDKYRLRIDYNYTGPMDDKFIAKYRDPKIRRLFKNLQRVESVSGATGFGNHNQIDLIWRQIQSEERENHKFMMEMGELGAQNDLNRRYVFDQHRYSLGFLKLAGFINVTDPQFIHRVILVQRFRSDEKKYWNNINFACTEFSLKTPKMKRANDLAASGKDLAWLIYILEPINKLLSIMYGVSITSKISDKDMFYLSQCNLFTSDPQQSAIKNLPLLVAADPVRRDHKQPPVVFDDELYTADPTYNELLI